MIAIIVSHCTECPFVINSLDSEPWLCDASGFEERHAPRQLPEQRIGDVPDPPEWCPLRKADRLVTLRLRGAK